MKITFWGKQVALHNVGGPHSVSRRPSKGKDWPPQERKNSTYRWSPDWTATSVSPWVPSLTARLKVLDLPLRLPEPVLYICVCMCVCVCARTIFLLHTHAHPTASFLWRTLTNTCMNWNVKNKPEYFYQPTQITSLLPIHPGTSRVRISPWGVDFRSIVRCPYSLSVCLQRTSGCTINNECQQCDQIAPSFSLFWDFLGHPLNKLTQLVRRAA